MKKLLSLTVLLALVPFARSNQADDAAIHQRSDDWCAAWNHHDPKLMASFFTEDGDLINPFGAHAAGRPAIEALFDHEQAGTMAHTTYHATVENIRYPSKYMAIVDIVGEIDGLQAHNNAPVHSFMHHATWICEKRHGKWMAIAVRAFVFTHPNDIMTAQQ
jgi:uncharacterized protein (TIGR02246 family)